MDKLKTKIQEIRAKVTRSHLFIAGATVLMLAIIVPMLTILLGYDKYIIPTSISGTVRDSDGQIIEGAEVKIQDKSALTNAQGMYELKDLVYGIYPLQVEKNGYRSFSEEYKLGRFSNEKDVTLELLQYGELEITFTAAENVDFNQMTVSLNDEPLEASEEKYLSQRVLTDVYTLSIRTPLYKDIEREIDIEPGLNSLEIELEPAADIVAEFRDWLAGTKIVPDKIEVKIDGTFQEVEKSKLEENLLTLNDLELEKGKVVVKAVKTGYNEYLQEVNLKQGITTLDQVYLVKKGKLVRIINENGLETIYVTNYDHSSPVSISSSTAGCTLLAQNVSKAVVECGIGDYRVISLNEQNPKIISTINLNAKLRYFDFYQEKIYFVDAEKPNLLQVKASSGTSELAEADSEITSITVTNDADVIIATADSVLKYESETTELVEITNGNFSLSADPNSNSQVIMLNGERGSQNVWTLNLENGNKNKLTFLPGVYADPVFINDTQLIYLKNNVLYKHSIGTNSPTTLTSGYNSMVPIHGSDIIILGGNEANALYSLESDNLVSLR